VEFFFFMMGVVVLCALIGIGVATGLLSRAWSAVFRGARAAAPGRSSLADRVLDLLEEDPKGWKLGEHVAWHPATGLSVWVANEDYGLKVWIEPDASHFGHCPSKNAWVSRPPAADRVALLHAIKMMGERNAVRRIDRALAKFRAAQESAAESGQ